MVLLEEGDVERSDLRTADDCDVIPTFPMEISDTQIAQLMFHSGRMRDCPSASPRCKRAFTLPDFLNDDTHIENLDRSPTL
jgi:hypothetical protein